MNKDTIIEKKEGTDSRRYLSLKQEENYNVRKILYGAGYLLTGYS